MEAALSAQNSQAEVSKSQAPPQTTTATSTATTAPVYSTTLPIPTSIHDGSASGFPIGWDLMTGYGMHPDFFITPSKTQFSPSATQPMISQPNPSATQPMGSQQDALVGQPNAKGTWSP